MSRAPALASAERALVDELACRVRARSAPALIGIAGAQGSGKSTLAARLAPALAAHSGLRAVVLSLDDFYLTHAERAELARDVHPLLRTRGVPGTHDVALAERTIDALLHARAGETLQLPRFDKARDDRMPQAQSTQVEGPIDLLLFEGWCVGAEPEADAALQAPCNALEREHDADGRFRRYVNAQLAGPYRALFARLHAWLYLAVPDLQTSFGWRRAQEAELRQRAGAHAPRVMDEAELERFAQHFERITRHMLAEAPGRADIVLRLAADHSIAALQVRQPCAIDAR